MLTFGTVQQLSSLRLAFLGIVVVFGLALPVKAEGLPDASIKHAELQVNGQAATKVLVGDQLYVYVEVENAGDATLPSTRINYLTGFPSTVFNTDDTVVLEPGEVDIHTSTTRVAGDFPLGISFPGSLSVALDPANLVAESNETNNTKTLGFTIFRRIDLTSVSLNTSPSPGPGSTITLNYGLSNPADINESTGLIASIRHAVTGDVFTDVANEIAVDATPGSSIVSRSFLIPPNAPLGKYHVTFTIRKGLTGRHWETITVNNALTLINTPPIISPSIPPQTIDEDTVFIPFDLDNFVVDPDTGETLTWNVAGDNNLVVTIDIDNIVAVVPPANWFGSEELTFTVTDSLGQSDSQSVMFTVNPVNDVPVITSTPIIIAIEDELYSYNVNAYDVEGDALTFSLIGSPAGMTIQSSTGFVEWLPGNNDIGLHNVKIQVFDGTDNAIQSYSLSVTNVNDAPVITSTPPTSILEGLPYSYQIIASDIDNSPSELSYSLVSAPTGMIISTNGLVTWATAHSDVGDHEVAIRVSDGELEATQIFTLTVVLRFLDLIDEDFSDLTGWSSITPGIQIGNDNGTIKLMTSNARRDSEVTSMFMFAMPKGKYNLSADIKSENASHPEIKVRAYDESLKLLGEIYNMKAPSGTHKWTSRQGNFKVPLKIGGTDVEYLQVVLVPGEVNNTKKGTAATTWFDNVKLELF